jgi:hypothetical protein
MVTIYNPLTSFVVDAVEARQMVTIYNLLTYMLCGRRGRTEIIIANVARGGSKGGAGGAPAPPNFLISMLITVAKTWFHR